MILPDRKLLCGAFATGVVLFALVLGSGVCPVRSRASATLTDPPPARSKNGVETFDAAWQIIYESHFDTHFNGVDWPALRAELRPKAEAARSGPELREVIERMLSRLGESHMSLIPGNVADAFDPTKVRPEVASAPARPSSAPIQTNGAAAVSPNPEAPASASLEGDAGFDVRLIDGRSVVSRVDSDGPAHAAGVKTGWILEAVGSERLADRLEKLPAAIDRRKAQFMAWRMAKALLLGPPGSKARIVFLNARNRPVTLTLERQRTKGALTKLGFLPALRTHLETRRLKSASGADVGLIRFNFFMIPIAAPFDQAIDAFRSADGIVIDLRGNLGGIGGMVMGFAGHFLKDRLSLGTMKMRGNDLQFFANPRWVNPAGQRVEPFRGPLAILIDGVSLSAAEIFAGGLQDVGRARLFGETSPGQALPAVWDRLPNGDVLYHAIADYVLTSGLRLEGRGVVPDEVVPLTRKDLLAGRDRALLAAMQWISRQRKTGATFREPGVASGARDSKHSPENP